MENSIEPTVWTPNGDAVIGQEVFTQPDLLSVSTPGQLDESSNQVSYNQDKVQCQLELV